MKYVPRENLPKEVKDMCSEAYKILMKERKDDTNRWRYIPCSQITGVSTLKMTILLKTIYRCNAIPIKLLLNSCSQNQKKRFYSMYGNMKDRKSERNSEKEKK